MRRSRQLIKRFGCDKAGSIAVIAGLSIPVLAGFCGLGAETAYWYFRNRDLQGAADIAAHNGAIALEGGSTAATVTAIATGDARTNGWNSGAGTIAVNSPPLSGTHQTNSAVEVILTENEPRYFTAIFIPGQVPIKARAVALINTLGTTCILALNKSASGAVTFQGNTTGDFTNCNVYSDSISGSGFMVAGSAQATMPCALSAGGFAINSGLHLTSCPQPDPNAVEVADPYASLPAPPIPPSCTNGGGHNLSPGKYCNGLSFSGNTTLASGTYVIDGGTLKVNASATVTGSGVMFYLTNGATVSMNGNATVTLSASTTGTYSGILFFGDRTQANATNKFNGTASSTMTGVIYFASQLVELLGNFTGTNGCMQVVADTIYESGNSTFSSNCTNYGMASLVTPGAVTVVE